MFEWISLHDHPPAENGRYLVTNGVEVDIGWYSTRHGMFFEGDGVVVFAPMIHITHWMELPDARISSW